MCNCIDNICEKLKEKNKTMDGRKIIDITPQCELFDIVHGRTNYGFVFNVEVEKQKKFKTTYVIMDYCPFCGENWKEKRKAK